MEKSETMKRYEAETGKQSTRFVTDGIHSAGIEVWHYEYIAWLETKASAYDRLMSGGKKTPKEVSNFLDLPIARDAISDTPATGRTPSPFPTDGRRPKMTREHRAWEMLIRRLNYLNSFDGNRSEMEKTTRIVEQIWDDAGHDEEPEDPDFYPVENIGFDNSAVDCVLVQEIGGRMNHTKEPWKADLRSGCFAIYPNGPDRNCLDCASDDAIVYQNGRGDKASPDGYRYLTAEQEANAKRIVACVNACAGITNEALEAGIVEEALVAYLGTHDRSTTWNGMKVWED